MEQAIYVIPKNCKTKKINKCVTSDVFETVLQKSVCVLHMQVAVLVGARLACQACHAMSHVTRDACHVTDL